MRRRSKRIEAVAEVMRLRLLGGADPLVPRRRPRRPDGAQERVQGDPRGPGGPPHKGAICLQMRLEPYPTYTGGLASDLFHCVRPAARASWVRPATLLTPSFFIMVLR